tara:strand:- start:42 stop:683 length:642 start_codon:yes stop_codon:yes gene_type:complete
MFETIVNPDGTISIVPVEQTTNLPFNVGGRLFDQFNTAPGILSAPSFNTFANTVAPMGVNTGIMSQAPGRFLDNAGLPLIDTSFGVANEPDDPDDVDKAKNTKRGIASLFEFLSNLPTPLNLLRRGLDSLSGINQRIRSTDFGQSTSFADFLQKRRDRRAREEAAKIGAAKQKEIIASQQVDTGGGPGSRPGGFGIGAGDFSPSDPTATEGSF